ncbi:MAG: hypothetical protein WCY21_07665, partial [Candidatus Cloacimonadaceae bacterium]|nr:hypothetical protein [Candidatus Cloacimonadota bacterium]
CIDNPICIRKHKLMDRNISYLSDKHTATTTIPHFFGGMPSKTDFIEERLGCLCEIGECVPKISLYLGSAIPDLIDFT